MYLANYTRPDISFLSIYYQDIVLHLHEDIGMESNMYFVSFEMQVICQILIMVDHKRDTCLQVEIQPFHGDLYIRP
jgi:hypothetical protein